MKVIWLHRARACAMPVGRMWLSTVETGVNLAMKNEEEYGFHLKKQMFFLRNAQIDFRWPVEMWWLKRYKHLLLPAVGSMRSLYLEVITALPSPWCLSFLSCISHCSFRLRNIYHVGKWAPSEQCFPHLAHNTEYAALWNWGCLKMSCFMA